MSFTESCVCGRPRVPQHCHVCGKGNIYNQKRRNRSINNLDGTKTIVLAFHCRRCGADFDELDLCDAPNFKHKSMAEKRAYEQAEDLVAKVYSGDPEARLKGIEEVLKLVPAKPKEPSHEG